MSFQSSQTPSIGVELEMQLLDPFTKDLKAASIPFLRKCRQLKLSKIKSEIHQSMIEVESGICSNAKQIRKDLSETLSHVHSIAHELGLSVATSGTHPFQDWKEREFYPSSRYLFLYEKFRWLAQRMNIYGMHVHVGISSGDEAIALMNEAARFLPHLLALSASSPFWSSSETGFHSCRYSMIETFPYAGIPPFFPNWDSYRTYCTTLLNNGAISSLKDLYWYIRPNWEYGTLEFRICDASPMLSETIAISAFIHCLVVWLGEKEQAEQRTYEGQQSILWHLPHNLCNAARDGLQTTIIVDNTGSTKKLKEDIEDMIDRLIPIAQRLDCLQELLDVRKIIELGVSSVRQFQVYEKTRSHAAVVEALIHECAYDEPVVLASKYVARPAKRSSRIPLISK